MISLKQAKINAVNNTFDQWQNTLSLDDTWYRWAFDLPYEDFINKTKSIPNEAIKFIDVDHDFDTERTSGLAFVHNQYSAGLA